MTTSKFKAYGIFALLSSGILFIGIGFMIYVLVSVVFLGGDIIPRGSLPPFGAIIFIIVLLFLLAKIIYAWVRFAFYIKIDADNKAISFRNIITRKTTLYSFNDFDCYLDTLETPGRGNPYKVVYLIKEYKAVKIMSGFYYSNMEELQNAISSIAYIGFHPNFSTLARKALLNKEII
jgi:hypothetical protein